MKNKLKRILGVITAISLLLQMSFVITSNAAEYFSLDFESATDTMGWTSANAPGDMSIATDEDNSINKYFKFANTNGSGTRNAYYTFDSDAQTTENGKAVIEFDFYMTNTGNENINQLVLLDSAAGNPKGNANYSGNNYIFSFTQPKNSDKLIINNLDGSKETYTTTDWTNKSGWTHAKAIMDFTEHNVTITLSSHDGETVYFDNKVPMGTTDLKIGKLLICEARKNTVTFGIDNILVRSYDSSLDAGNTYYKVTYDVKGEKSEETVKENTSPLNIPDLTNYGYIFKGWQVNDDTENLIDDLKEYKITADTKFTAIYEKDTEYIEPIISAEIKGNQIMTFGDSPDIAAENKYTLTLTGQNGTVITADTIDSRIDDFNIEWDIDGFKTVNDTDKYCDSYGEFAEHTNTATEVLFMLRQCDFNFYGKLNATVTYNGETIEASMYVAATGDKSMADNQILPEAGYPSDFDEYPDSLVGYTTLKDTYGGNDIMVGGWGMSGSDSGDAVIMKEENNKFLRINCPTSSKSHMFTNSIDTPQKQIIFEQNIRFNGNGCITLTSKQPYWTDKEGYTTPVTLEFDGTTIKLNGIAIKNNDIDVTVNKGKWYKIVLSADKTTESCFVKVYDLNGQFVGETDSIAWTENSEPTYYSIGFANKQTGTVDFDAYRAYYPAADISTYTLNISQETLSIPNKDTATLSASVKSKEGYNITGAAEWSILEDDMQDIIITPDVVDSHKATITLGEGASAGEATVQVNIGGYTKTIKLNITDSAESIKFTSSQGSLAIPLDEKSVNTAKYSAAVINGDGMDLNRNVSLGIYDKNNVNKYNLPDGISFDASAGTISVTSAAVPCVFTVRATGESSDGKILSRSVKVTVHGLSFDFGSGADESVTEGYTDINPLTTYTVSRGYGIEGSAKAEGTPSIDNAESDYLSGDFTFKAKVTKGKHYRVKIAFSGDLVSEYVSEALSGHERTLAAEGTTHTGYTVKTEEITEQVYDIPVVDDVMDLKFSGARVAYISIEKVEKTAAEKPNIWSVGDSTIGNSGSYAYNLARDQANYPEFTALADYHNNGKGSRNLKTYYTQGWLDNILINIRPGDIVTIGNMGTNPGGMSGTQFKAPLDYYVDACLAMGAKVILTSYTPHGCVEGYEYVYDKTTHTFHGCREDAYDSLGIRVIYEERKDDPDILGFIDIGLNADNAFNEYVADYAKNGYENEDAAAKAIMDCFGDHNHYGNGGRSQLAGDLMLNGYGTAPGIVSELVRVLTESTNKPCVKIEAEYDDNGTLVNLTTTPAKVSEAQKAERSKNSLITYWYSFENMRPVINE
ncbi:MAG: InlB B-repeat-containing protein [Firmicutes bacterium]|nr:InlB B-repeat-containing protein [Bacillota bacterium]